MEAGKDCSMTIKLIGSLLIVIGCGVAGFSFAARYKKEEQSLRDLIKILDYLSCELQYRLTPLAQLCRQASLEGRGIFPKVFQALANELDRQITADVEICMKVVLAKTEGQLVKWNLIAAPSP